MPHGVANAVLLPYVIEYNSSECKERYATVATALGIDTINMTCDQASEKAIRFIKELSSEIGIPTLKSLGFKPEDTITLSINATNDTCISDNPKEASITDIKSIFLNAYNS